MEDGGIIMKNLTKALTAGALAIGLTLAATTPAEAVTLYRYCNWPQHSAVYVHWSLGRVGTVTAYSPGGTRLGSRTGRWIEWKSPWEDVKWSASGYVFIKTACK
jgi:hypothetical protein